MIIFSSNLHKYIELDVKEIPEIEVFNYLRENPTHYLFNGREQFICNIYGKPHYMNRACDISSFTFKDKEKIFTNRWCALEPVKFVDAVKAWDCGIPILSKSNDLYHPFILVNDNTMNRDDISFDGIDVLVKQWFKFVV